MTILEDPDREYGLVVGEPYLWRDYNGKYCILQDETMLKTDENGHVNALYSSEELVDPNPSEAEIFKFILAGKVKKSGYRV